MANTVFKILDTLKKAVDQAELEWRRSETSGKTDTQIDPVVDPNNPYFKLLLQFKYEVLEVAYEIAKKAAH